MYRFTFWNSKRMCLSASLAVHHQLCMHEWFATLQLWYLNQPEKVCTYLIILLLEACTYPLSLFCVYTTWPHRCSLHVVCGSCCLLHITVSYLNTRSVELPRAYLLWIILLAKCIALWVEPEQAVARRGEGKQSGWFILLLHLHNMGRRSMCMWHVFPLSLWDRLDTKSLQSSGMSEDYPGMSLVGSSRHQVTIA